MKILQFLCPQDPPATQLKALIIDQINTWSRLQRLSKDPDYITSPFGDDTWYEHTTIQGLWWMNYDSVYAAVGDDGRKIADQLLGDGPLQGILRMAPLVQQLPDTRLQIVDVEDAVESGYLPTPPLTEGV